MMNGEGNLDAIWIAVGQDEGGQGELGGQSVDKLSGGQVGNPFPVSEQSTQMSSSFK